MNGNVGQPSLSATEENGGSDRRCQSAICGGLLPKEAKQEQSANTGCEEAGKFLNVLECLLKLPEQRLGNDERNDHSGQADQPTDGSPVVSPIYLAQWRSAGRDPS